MLYLYDELLRFSNGLHYLRVINIERIVLWSTNAILSYQGLRFFLKKKIFPGDLIGQLISQIIDFKGREAKGSLKGK